MTALRQILIGLAYIGQMIDFGDRDLQATSVDQAGKFCKYLGIRRRAVALRLDAVFRGRREVDDRIDPIGRDNEFERQIHIAAAERVDEGIDFASGCGSDPIRASPIAARTVYVDIQNQLARPVEACEVSHGPLRQSGYRIQLRPSGYRSS